MSRGAWTRAAVSGAPLNDDGDNGRRGRAVAGISCGVGRPGSCLASRCIIGSGGGVCELAVEVLPVGDREPSLSVTGRRLK